MLEESIDFAEQDFAARQLIEARNEAETILRATEKSLADEASREMPVTERRAIGRAMTALRDAAEGADYKLVRTRIDELNRATAHLAELLMNSVLHATVEGKRLDEV
jgi:molecular chaperone DnaK (HSP70)